MTRSLIDIIENTPIAFRPMLKFYKPLGNDNYIELTAKGMMRPFTFDYNGITMRSYGVALSTDCDNMGKTLLHEYLHIQDEHMPEPEIEQLTNKYWNILPIRKTIINKLVEKLNK